ncbi:unnamed protein product [Symbiodinium natans]|uniref:Uncharacterized protein n=1 Tax=Symbiodinium natans TaxID=878477 RepID=A0A812UJ38_9DINO|nr:unnamed protein product [Symbiodinium natans]
MAGWKDLELHVFGGDRLNFGRYKAMRPEWYGWSKGAHEDWFGMATAEDQQMCGPRKGHMSVWVWQRAFFAMIARETVKQELGQGMRLDAGRCEEELGGGRGRPWQKSSAPQPFRCSWRDSNLAEWLPFAAAAPLRADVGWPWRMDWGGHDPASPVAEMHINYHNTGWGIMIFVCTSVLYLMSKR